MGDRIVAVATTERVAPGEAEVAFLVADSEHGRGLGSLLLEHLAAACRDQGIQRFVAEVLPENTLMIRVFQDAGFAVSRWNHSGVISVGMSTEASADAIAAADLRESVSEAKSLAPLLYPQTVAVVGVRRAGAGLGHAVLASILDGGFKGRVYLVHPAVSAIDGVSASPCLAAVPEHIDLAIIAVPAARVLATIQDAANAGVSSVVVISSSLGELGAHGAELQRHMLRVARENNIRLVGPNCLGVMSNDPGIRLNRPSPEVSHRPEVWPLRPNPEGSESRCSTSLASSASACSRSSRSATRQTSPATTFWPPGSTIHTFRPPLSTWSPSATLPNSLVPHDASPSASRSWQSSVADPQADNAPAPPTQPLRHRRPWESTRSSRRRASSPATAPSRWAERVCSSPNSRSRLGSESRSSATPADSVCLRLTPLMHTD